MLLAGAPILELPIRKTCNFDKPLNHILKVKDGCMHIFLPCKHQNTHNYYDGIATESVFYRFAA